ncbi:MAG: hypothetical protein RhofKO_08640 [Rhodothermales bacterium]
MPSGRILTYDSEAGSGTIQPDVGGDDIIFSREALSPAHKDLALAEGDRVVYDVEGGMAGTHISELRFPPSVADAKR